MSQAAYKTIIKVGGNSTAFVDESTLALGGNQFQVTDSTKRVFDRRASVTVYDNGNEVTPVSIDFLFGVIELSGAPGGDVTVDASYIPLGNIGGSMEYSLDIGGDILDDTNFNQAGSNGGYRTKGYGLIDVSASVGRYDDLAKTFKNHKKNRSEVFIEIRPGGASDVARGWFVLENANSSGDIGGLESESLQFNLSDLDGKSFSFRTV